MKTATANELKREFEEGQRGVKEVPRWDEFGNGWWHGEARAMTKVPGDWPFDSAGFPNDWEAYARFLGKNQG